MFIEFENEFPINTQKIERNIPAEPPPTTLLAGIPGDAWGMLPASVKKTRHGDREKRGIDPREGLFTKNMCSSCASWRENKLITVD